MSRYNYTGQVRTIAEINAELEKIANSMDSLFSREGENPNALNGALDMNGNPIINLPFPQSGSSPLRLMDVNTSQLPEVLVPNTYFNVVDYGAVGDGSTDSTAAFAAAVAAISAAGGGVLFIPKGVFRVASAISIVDNMHVQGVGMFQSVIKKTDNAPDSAVFAKPNPDQVITRVSFDNLTIEGNWDFWRRERGGSLVSGRNIREAYFTSVRFMHGTGFGINLNRCLRVLVDQCRFRYICRDMCGVWATPQTIVTNCHLEGNDDDAISLNNEADVGTLDGELVKSGLIVSNNTLVDTGAIRVQQAKTTVVHSNTFQRCKGGSAVYVGAENAGLSRMSNPHTTLITNNVVNDMLDRSVSTELAPTDNFRIAFKIETIESEPAVGDNVAPGVIDSATGRVNKPYSGYYDHTNSNNLNPISRVDTVVIKDNVVKRTLPLVANYGDWGFGSCFTRFSTDSFASTGFHNAPIIEALLRCNGIRLEGPMYNVYIKGNIFDHAGRFYIWPNLSTFSGVVRNLYWDNVVIENNVFRDFTQVGVELGDLFQNTFQNVIIRQNKFDGDPNFRSIARELDGNGACTGGWLAQDNVVGVNASSVSGIKILENEFANVSVPYRSGTTVRKIVRNRNMFRGEPAVNIPPNTFSTLNKGIGLFPAEVLDDNSLVSYEVSDPRQANYLEQLDQPEKYVSGNNPPDYGFYFSGQYVPTRFSTEVTGTKILGFRRLTTGNTHVLNTDWEAVSVITNILELPSSGGGGTPTPTPTPTPTEQWVPSGNNISITHGACNGITYVDTFIYTLENRDPGKVHRVTNYFVDGLNFTLNAPSIINTYADINWDSRLNTRWVIRSGVLEEYDSTWALTGRTITAISNPVGIGQVANDYWVVDSTGVIHRVDDITLLPTGFTINTGFSDITSFAAEGDAGTDQRVYFLRENGDVYRVNIDGTNQVLVLSTGLSVARGLDVRGNKMVVCTSTAAVEYTK